MNWVAEQIEWLKSFFQENKEGKASSRRIIELAVAWSFIFSYVRVAILSQAMPPIDIGWVVMLAGILGLKTADIYFKNKTNNDNGKT